MGLEKTTEGIEEGETSRTENRLLLQWVNGDTLIRTESGLQTSHGPPPIFLGEYSSSEKKDPGSNFPSRFGIM